MQRAFEILRRLQDGAPHSGADIASALDITRAAVWNHVKRLQGQGVVIHAVRGKGYQLPGGYEFLDATAIRHELAPLAARRLATLDVNAVTDSTNQRLLAAAGRGEVHGHALVAEYQTAGRGRRGDQWLAPPGSGVCLSLGWRFDAPPATLSALSLCVGIAVARALAALGAQGLRLKWPNDVLHAGRKLAGILIEMRSEFGGPCVVVIGIGANVNLGDTTRARIPQPTADLAEACGRVPSRNRVVAAILSELVAALETFGSQGFPAFEADWRHFDALDGRHVRLELPERNVSGIARGVAPSGMLMIEHDGGLEGFISGHVRIEDEA
ncbi:MAG: biotin--[acetyl-CoA-carboxylase] ligase [Gammaproteobacteria bacterium]|nr:biotin--[acetyl-CoA-carboxylase] ligase [Gammaproteobacteria bacterium]MBI5616940.1 biotin--[acetyl-CoA-carboxylase] ligase [Gammaproteobacteria bacterium]